MKGRIPEATKADENRIVMHGLTLIGQINNLRRRAKRWAEQSLVATLAGDINRAERCRKQFNLVRMLTTEKMLQLRFIAKTLEGKS